MTLRIEITASAEADLQAIYNYRLAKRGVDGVDGADALLKSIYQIIASLSECPNKGPIPQELDAIGIKDWRQLSAPPYRIIYTINDSILTVAIIANARQNFADVLERRILRSKHA